MTDTIDDLRKRVEALERRVNRLEDIDDGNHTPTEETGLDHRDVAVLNHIREHGDPGKRGTKKLYKELTDISRNKTAVRRAKQLRNSKRFAAAVKQ